MLAYPFRKPKPPMSEPVKPGAKLVERPYYEEQKRELEFLKIAADAKIPVLLKGPTGCGKSRLIECLAYDLGRELVSVSCNEDTSATELIGRYLVKGQETIWQDGPLTRSVRNGAVVYLDEVIEAREDVLVLIHSLTDHRRTLFVDALSQPLVAPDSFMLVMSYNPGYQRSYKELKASTKQRFIAINLNYPDPELEEKILIAESGASKALAKKLVGLANKIRPLDELNLVESVSTRLLVYTSRLIQKGIEARQAATMAIVNTLSDDTETTKALRDLVSLYL